MIVGDENRYDPATQRFYTGLWQRTPSGDEASIVAMTERPPDGAGVLQDKEGNRYVTQWISNTDRRIQLLRRRPNGHVDLLVDETQGASPPTAVTVASVGGMTFGSDGSLYFANADKLWRRMRDGRVGVAYRGGRKSSLRGVSAAQGGRVIAADMGMRTVQAIDATGAAATLYREKDGWLPTAAAIRDGRLLVLEANANPYEYDDRVRLVEVTQGSAKILASPGKARPVNTSRSLAPSPGERRSPGQGFLIVSLVLACVALAAFLMRVKGR
jgi:hypothetical protein